MMGGTAGAWPAFARGFVSRAVRVGCSATVGVVSIIRLALFYRVGGGGYCANGVPLVMAEPWIWPQTNEPPQTCHPERSAAESKHLRLFFAPFAKCRVLFQSSFPGWKRRRIEPGDATIGADDEGQRESIPVAVVERLPGLAVVAAEVRAVGSDGDPEFEALGPLHGAAEAVGRSGGGGPMLAVIVRPCSCACAFVGFGVIAANCNDKYLVVCNVTKNIWGVWG